MMTIDQLLGPKDKLSPDHLREISAALHEVGKQDKMTLDETALIAAASGLVNGIAKLMEARRAPPAAAGQPDNLTLEDM